jgi:hypothetical protein
MRYLKKKDDGTVYVWTEALAKRSDMTEVSAADAGFAKSKSGATSAPVPAQPEVVSGASNPAADSSSDADDIDPLAITDKAELKRLLTERGVKVSGNPSLTTLQAKLAEALKG